MDFFDHQDAARRKTSLLVFYFLLAVVLIILAVYAVFWVLFAAGSPPPDPGTPAPPPPSFWNPGLFMWVAGGIVTIVVIGTLTKIMALSGGGESVARMLGARPVEPGTANPDEKRLLNVVEETAIASGAQVPRVYLLDGDDTINAFAAGFATEDAIVGVTRGCMTRLSRDELQGVIAHEFSHILNGDMRLNIRLMGTLHGILVLGIIGYWIFWSALYSSPRGSFGGGRRRGGNPLPLILLGLSVMAIGYIGVFFGKLIKSAVSRQREFLADASSVQFTRNPGGIAGALRKIGEFNSRISHPNAEQASHLFFANGLRHSFSNLMATHPPLAERIRRLEPYSRGEPERRPRGSQAPASHATAAAPDSKQAAASFAAPSTAGEERIVLRPQQVIESIGNPQPEHMAYVSRVLSSLPEQIKAAAHNTAGAMAVLYGLLLKNEPPVLDRQLKYLSANTGQPVYRETLNLSETAMNLPPQARLPLVDIALTTLRTLSLEEFEGFRNNLKYLAAADNKTSLFEYALQRIMTRHLDSAFGGGKKHPVKQRDLKPLLPRAAVVLSALAHHGAADSNEELMIFNAGAQQLSDCELSLLPPDQCVLDKLDEALNVLAGAAPKIRKRLLGAAVACIAANGRTTIAEVELLRAIADSLDCPMPPVLPGLKAA